MRGVSFVVIHRFSRPGVLGSRLFQAKVSPNSGPEAPWWSKQQWQAQAFESSSLSPHSDQSGAGITRTRLVLTLHLFQASLQTALLPHHSARLENATKPLLIQHPRLDLTSKVLISATAYQPIRHPQLPDFVSSPSQLQLRAKEFFDSWSQRKTAARGVRIVIQQHVIQPVFRVWRESVWRRRGPGRRLRLLESLRRRSRQYLPRLRPKTGSGKKLPHG